MSLMSYGDVDPEYLSGGTCPGERGGPRLPKHRFVLLIRYMYCLVYFIPFLFAVAERFKESHIFSIPNVI